MADTRYSLNAHIQQKAADDRVRQVQELLERGYGVTMEHDEILVERARRGPDQELP